MNEFEQLFQKKYSQLNAEQKEAVDAIEGPVAVVAGPGTGKTTLLTLRIANILKQTDVAPDNILALTFTNAGVHAMRKKLLDLIGDRAYQISLYTFHSFAEHIIKEYGFYFPQFEQARVITELEKLQTVEKIIATNSFEHITSKFDQLYAVRSVAKAIDTLKQEGVTPTDLPKRIVEWKKDLYEDESLYYKRKYGANAAGDIKKSEEEKLLKKIARAEEIKITYEAYQEYLEKNHLYDFSDMILSTIAGLEKSEDFQFDIAEQYQYILVDEHQDTNEGQNKIIELLTAAPHLENRPNIFTVGDEKQSIYRFQGASKEAFERFETMYSDVKTIALQSNYRSYQAILDASHELIQESIPDAVQLTSQQTKDVPEAVIHTAEFSNTKFESLYVVDSIQKHIAAGVSAEEIAVIYRSNKEVQTLQDAFNAFSISHTIQSHEYVLDNVMIQNIILLFRVCNSIKDNHAVAKSLFIDFLCISPLVVSKTLSEYDTIRRAETNENKISLFEYLESKDEYKKFVTLISNCISFTHNNTLDSFFKYFLDESSCLEFALSQNNSQERLTIIDKFFDEIKRLLDAHKNLKLKDFLEIIAIYETYGVQIVTANAERSTGVQLVTAHKSKGLEFEYVYIINAVRQNWEKSGGFNSIALPVETYKGGVDDERRLFYVAMTRAKKQLYITNAITNDLGVKKEKSQFLAELPENSYQNVDTKAFENSNADKVSIFLKTNNPDNTIFDSAFINDLYEKRAINVTGLNNFIQCPISYFFKNLLRLPSPYSASLAYGDAVHNALEEFFKQSVQSKKILSKEELLTLFGKKLGTLSMLPTELEHLRKRGEDSLGEYYETYKDTWSLDIALEQFVSRNLIVKDGLVTLNGRLDKIIFTDNSHSKIQVVDYKTGKTFSEKNKEQKVALERQLVFYHLLLENNDALPYKIESALLDFVEQNIKTNLYEQHSVQIDEEKINELKQEIAVMHQSVTSGIFLSQGCEKKDCEYCSLYNSIKNRA